MSIYDYTDYKSYLRNWLLERPKKGHGESRRMAQSIGVSTTMISQVLSGDKHFSSELSIEVCEFLGLNDLETDYFLLLVDYSRAGSFKLQKQLQKKIKKQQDEAQKIKNRIVSEKDLTTEEKNIFYSNWIYAGISCLVSTNKYTDVDQISEKLKMPRNQVQKAVDFLLSSGLLVLEKNKLKNGIKNIHLSVDSPLVNQHHRNWRLKGLEQMNSKNIKDLYYSAPFSVSEKDAQKIRDQLLSFIETLVKTVQTTNSPTQTICLGIDFFDF